MLLKRRLEPHELKGILQALKESQELHLKHATVMDQCAEAGGNPMITAESARLLAEEHRRQVQEVQVHYHTLQNADEIILTKDITTERCPSTGLEHEGHMWSRS